MEASHLLGDLLALAFARQGLPGDTLVFRPPASPGAGPAPSAVFVQQGGMRALRSLGVDTAALAARGVSVRSILLLDRNVRPLLSYAPSLPSSGPDPIWVPLQALREVVAQATAAAAIPPRSDAGKARQDEDEHGWTGATCPGILLRCLPGRLRRPGTHLVWDSPRAHVGLTQLQAATVFCYAVPHAVGSKDHELQACRDALDEAPGRLADHVEELTSPGRDEWFPLDRVGYRSCRGGDALRWGPGSLRLHPLTGQHLSYWAIQAIRVAADIARHGAPSAALFDRLDRDARAIYRRHCRSMAFYLRPSPVWRVLFRPYARALSHSAWLRRGTVSRIALLDLR